MNDTFSSDCSKSNSHRATSANVNPSKPSLASSVQMLLPLVAERDSRACQELVNMYAPDIERIAHHFTCSAGVDNERKADLKSFGKQELLKLADAAMKSGYNSGASSYISRFLYMEMQKEANKTKMQYTVSESLFRVIKTVKKCLDQFAQEYCTDKRPHANWIANETGLSEDKVLDALEYMYGGFDTIDVDTSYNYGDDDEAAYGPLDRMAAPDDTESLVYTNELKAIIGCALGMQSERDQRIFLRKMGLSNDRTNWTSELIAETEHMTVARVNQIVRQVQSDLRESITTTYRKAE